MVSGIDYDHLTGSFVYDDSQKSNLDPSSTPGNNNDTTTNTTNNDNNNTSSDNMVPDSFKSKMFEPLVSHVPDVGVSTAHISSHYLKCS